MQLMGNAPYDFCIHHTDKDLKKLMTFKHRTFNTTDLLYFIEFFKFHYTKYNSLEDAFSNWLNKKDVNIEAALNGFSNYFFSLPEVPKRTFKHIASPIKKSSCKRLCMFLRWMVRNDNNGVDFGIWKKINPSQLIIPLDLHVIRVAKRFNLINRSQSDWLAAIELTEAMKQFDSKDPVKYDFALFSLGALEKF